MSREAKGFIFCSVLFVLLFITQTPAYSQVLKPYILASKGAGTVQAKISEVKSSLTEAGFELAGEYAPYKDAWVVVVTSQALRDNAAKSESGAYGAVQRISITQSGNDVQVAYTNPLYMAQAYKMAGDLGNIAATLEQALGNDVDFGSKKGVKAKKLRNYHYMAFMPYFTDPVKLASHSSHEEALATVEKNLKAGVGGVLKVYRVDIPGQQASIFGVGLKSGKGADEKVMKVVDFGDLKQTAHLPYELVVIDGDVFSLHGKFRIALSFPDLSMPTFMKISGAPGGIAKSLKQVARK